MEEREAAKVNWVTCPECGAKIGILLSVGRETPSTERPAEQRPRSIDRPPSSIRERLRLAGVDLSLVDVDEGEDVVVISPKRFLGDLWVPINDAIRTIGGNWIREGRESRWEIRREELSEL